MRIPIVNRFTCSENQLSNIINTLKKKNMNAILDYTNEDSKNHFINFSKMKKLINKYPNSLIAVKLSSLNINNNIDLAEEYLDHLVYFSLKNNNKLLIDAENYEIQDNINKITNKFMETYNKEDVIIYKTYQMYRKDSFNLLKNDFNKNRNYFIGCKLVRGAYYNQDVKYNILYKNIEETHKNYNYGIELFCNNYNYKDKLLCATHNQYSINYAIQMIKNKNLDNIEFAQLMGMSDRLSKNIAENYTVYKYVPYGDFKDTLPYLIRRLYENYPMIFNLFK